MTPPSRLRRAVLPSRPHKRYNGRATFEVIPVFLKCLDIFGFKSFADRTHVDFADGITALLGPNGCGKSNVVDAIKWVLAESRSKNLRADKMEDVIFKGTERRPPLGVAEVTLTILNESGLLPMSESEIAIRRRIYRSGESEYSINGRPAGPKEIRSLFMDTGVGKSAYSVMEQGKIDQILSSKPEDRRYLFEEAAGISRSKAECAEAERDLERARANMKQIEISLAEIKRQYDTLKVQADKTKRFRAVKDEIFGCELDLALLRLKEFAQGKARAEESLKETERKRGEARREIEEITDTLSANMDKVKSMQEQIYSKQADLIGAQKEKSGKQDLANQFKLRLRESAEKSESLEARKKNAQEQIDALNGEIDELEAQLREKAKQLDGIQKNIAEFERSVQSAAGQIESNDREVFEANAQIARDDDERSALQKDLAAITEDIVAMLDSRLKDAGFSEGAMKAAKEKLDGVLARLKVFAQGRKNVFSDFASSCPRAADDCARNAREAAEALSEVEAMALEMEAALGEYMKASPAFITEFLSPEGIMTKKRAIDLSIADNKARVDALRAKIDALRESNESLSKKIDECKETLSRLRVNDAKMREQMEASAQKAALLRRTAAESAARVRETCDDIDKESRAAAALREKIEETNSELEEIERRGMEIAEALKTLDAGIAKLNSSVSGKQGALRKKQDEQNALQSQYEKLSLSLVSFDTEIKNVKQNFQDAHSRDLMEFEERMYKIREGASAIREKLNRARESQKDLGQVNHMAVEEFAEVKDRYERQRTNFDDTKKSLENLQRVSAEIRAKSSEMFLDTYNKIKKNFHNMFRRLFNGGRAELKLSDPENLLSSGIDILAQPPGKKLENIALLSGGEKTMTAVALLFATYQVRPSPFCLLDEIDAALDDRSVLTLVSTLRSFSGVSQYIVITHNKKTVTGAKTMLGVTMEEPGVSKILTMRLDRDIKLDLEEGADGGEFVEEDVELEDAVVPPRPAKRIHNPDGSVTDPEREKDEALEMALEKEAARRAGAESAHEPIETEARDA